MLRIWKFQKKVFVVQVVIELLTLIQNIDNTNSWQGDRATGIHMFHCWWEHKVIQLLRKRFTDSKQLVNSLTIWLSHSNSRYLFKLNENMCPPENLNINVHSGFICNSFSLRKLVNGLTHCGTSIKRTMAQQ